MVLQDFCRLAVLKGAGSEGKERRKKEKKKRKYLLGLFVSCAGLLCWGTDSVISPSIFPFFSLGSCSYIRSTLWFPYGIDFFSLGGNILVCRMCEYKLLGQMKEASLILNLLGNKTIAVQVNLDATAPTSTLTGSGRKMDCGNQ